MPRGGVPRDPMRAQQFRTQRAELPEDLWQPLYDRAHWDAPGLTTVNWFAISRGQSTELFTTHAAVGTWSTASRAKTFRDTNIENSNVVPTKMFKIVGVSLGYIHIDNAIAVTRNTSDREAVKSGGYLTFRIVDKDIIFLPLITIPEVNPVTGVATTANATTLSASSSGGGQNVPMYKFPIPITINPYENFTVSANFDSGLVTNGDMNIYLILHAYMRRPT